MHWSRPGALRTLDALRRLGGSGTTREIQKLTNSVAVHTEISSLRIYLETELGLGARAVRCEYAGRTDEGRFIYRYTLSREAMWGIRKQSGLFARAATPGQRAFL